VRLRAPRTWVQGVQVVPETNDTLAYRHVGAVGAEIEFQRYRPRTTLTSILDGFDLVQVVAGTPAWAQLCRDVRPPVALQVATLARVERTAALSGSTGVVGLWRQAMTRVTDWIDHRALDHVDVAFVENDWMRNHLAAYMLSERVVFAPPGIDTDRFVAGSTPPSGCDYLLSVGRFADARKNARLLFEAYARLRQRCPNAPRLVLAGRSRPTPAAWARADALRIRPHVTFLEDVPAADLPRLYREAALYVVSSDEEGLGMTILEAMASGRPVVSTRCGGPETTVVEGMTGLLTPVGDADALADAMRRALDDPDWLDAMGCAARARAVEHFSLRASGQRFLDEYGRLLGSSWQTNDAGCESSER
jgi:glycosyltransferase involved in cell wall biosynthesis